MTEEMEVGCTRHTGGKIGRLETRQSHTQTRSRPGRQRLERVADKNGI